MASKTTGKSQGKARPQAQGKEKQSKASGKGGAANGASSRKGAEPRGEQQRKTRPEARGRDERAQPQQEEAQDQAQQGQDEGQEQSEGSERGGATKVAETAKQHPITTAASIAGLTLLAAQGLRMAINSMGGNGSGAAASGQATDEDEGQEEDEDSAESSYDEEGEEGEEDDEEESPEASASAEDEESEEDEGDETDNEEGGRLSGRLRGIGSALRGSREAIKRGAQSGYERGREAAGQNWQSHPLLLCGVALAVGAAAGFLLPSTRQEDQMMGERSDKMTGRLKQTGQKFFRQGRQVAGKVVSEAINTTAREVEREGLTPDRLGKKVKRVASSVRQAVSDAVQDE